MPRSPLITLGPVLVTPAPPRTAKLSAVPRPTAVAACELLTSASISAVASAMVAIARWIMR